MSTPATFDNINDAKAEMGQIYDQDDPISYFRELNKLSYIIPSLAKPIFQKLISHLQSGNDTSIRLLDIGCSYGVNAALLKYDLSMPELYDHWDEQAVADDASDDVVAYSRDFLGTLTKHDDLSVVGLDVAESAVAFAEKVGLLDEAHAVNLETEQLPEAAQEHLAPVDLVISTGCVGYVTEQSFERLMPAVTQGRSPWMANFVLRMFSFDAIDKALQGWGYVTEKLEGQTFLQRNFASDQEQELLLEQLRMRGIDPTGQESEGQLLAEFYLSRPANDAAALPIERLIVA